MNKIIIAFGIVAIVVLGGFFFLKGSQRLPQPPTGQTPIAEGDIVTYTDTGYSPATLRIKAGGLVTFKNQSLRSMWTASAAHPTHRQYPTTGGCLGSTFDSCKGVQPGSDWAFRFDTPGAWKYHNHLRPGDTGTIVVE